MFWMLLVFRIHCGALPTIHLILASGVPSVNYRIIGGTITMTLWRTPLQKCMPETWPQTLWLCISF